MCVFTGLWLMKSSLPISAFESPRTIRRKTSRVVPARLRQRSGMSPEGVGLRWRQLA